MANVESSKNNPIVALIVFSTPLKNNAQFRRSQTGRSRSAEGVRPRAIRRILRGGFSALFCSISVKEAHDMFRDSFS
jgi:hypothetical protein